MEEIKFYKAKEVKKENVNELSEQEIKFVEDITYNAYLHAKDDKENNNFFHKILVVNSKFRVNLVKQKLNELGYQCSFELNIQNMRKKDKTIAYIYSFKLDWS